MKVRLLLHINMVQHMIGNAISYNWNEILSTDVSVRRPIHNLFGVWQEILLIYRLSETEKMKKQCNIATA